MRPEAGGKSQNSRKAEKAPASYALPRPLERRLRRGGYGYGYGVYRYMAQALRVTLPHYQRRWLEQLGAHTSFPHHFGTVREGQLVGTARGSSAGSNPAKKAP